MSTHFDERGRALCGTYGHYPNLTDEWRRVDCSKCLRRRDGLPAVPNPWERLRAAHGLIRVLWERQQPDWIGMSWEEPTDPPAGAPVDPDEVRELVAALYEGQT